MLDGASRIGDVVAAAVAADGQPAVGITDHGNMYGALPMYTAAARRRREADPRDGGLLHQHLAVRPAEARRARDLPPRRCSPRPTRAIATSSSSRAARTSTATTTSPAATGSCSSGYHEGITATSGCLGGLVSQLILAGDEKAARRGRGAVPGHLRARPLLRRAPGPRPGRRRSGVQVAPRHRPEAAGAPLLATNDSHYTNKDDAEVARRVALRADRRVEERREALQVRGRRLLHQVGRRDARRVPRAARRVRQHAADRGALPTSRSSSGRSVLPSFPVPEGHDENSYLRELTMEGRARALRRRRRRRT